MADGAVRGPRRRSSGRRTNLALLALVPLAVVSGLVSNAVGTNVRVDPAAVHGVIALAIVVLAPWKAVIARRGLRRWTTAAWMSLALVALVAATVLSGLVHAAGVGDLVGGLTVMQIHVGAGFLALGLVVAHCRAHPVRPRRRDLDRRAVVRGVGAVVVAALGWLGVRSGLHLAGAPGATRRFTGSHERGSYAPEQMPVTSWFDDAVPIVDPAGWSVRIGGRALSLRDLSSAPNDDVVAILDCTGGWYARQVWTGVRLDRLLEAGGHRSVLIRSATGYGRRFPVDDLDRLWLVTHVGGHPLSAGHGAPARIVAPGRRGFWWVKWVVDIQPSGLAWWVQPPFPLT